MTWPRALDRLSAMALELPEAEREISGRHSAFRVRGRTFAYVHDDHHGDGIVGLNAKAAPGVGSQSASRKVCQHVAGSARS